MYVAKKNIRNTELLVVDLVARPIILYFPMYVLTMLLSLYKVVFFKCVGIKYFILLRYSIACMHQLW
jgi:hypothetical protein